jgi:hypothetical protein
MMFNIGTIVSAIVAIESLRANKELCRGGRLAMSISPSSSGRGRGKLVDARARSEVGRYGDGGGGARSWNVETYTVGGVVMCTPVNGAADRGETGVMVDVDEMEHWEVRILAPKDEAEGEVGRDDRRTTDPVGLASACGACADCTGAWVLIRCRLGFTLTMGSGPPAKRIDVGDEGEGELRRMGRGASDG